MFRDVQYTIFGSRFVKYKIRVVSVVKCRVGDEDNQFYILSTECENPEARNSRRCLHKDAGAKNERRCSCYPRNATPEHVVD